MRSINRHAGTVSAGNSLLISVRNLASVLPPGRHPEAPSSAILHLLN
jgi:hypothetical protein